MIYNGTYVGIRRRLQGKTALIKPAPGGWRAQFDDITTRLGYGWHWFPHSAFKPRKYS